jgi:glycosyltransferase involved in cell wall biosynthesis
MIYADLDILALTSLNEGTPVSIIEAMAASVPVVTTGVGGIKDLLGAIYEKSSSHDRFQICERGILCPKNDPVTFANALEYIVNNDLLKESQQRRKAREFVLENYSVERLIKSIESLYDELAGRQL